MSQTKKKKVEEQSKVEMGGFRLKITNLKKEAFPDPLTSSDYHGFAVGDYIVKGRNNNNLFQVTEITREAFPDYQYQAILRSLNYKNNLGQVVIRDQKLYDLIEKYKKSHNFGVCWIKYKTIVRGGKVINNSRVTRFCEITHYHSNSYYKVVNPVTVMASKSSEATLIDYKIQKLLNKQKALNDTKNAIEAHLDSLKPKKPVQTETKPEPGPIQRVECVEDSLIPKLL